MSPLCTGASAAGHPPPHRVAREWETMRGLREEPDAPVTKVTAVCRGGRCAGCCAARRCGTRRCAWQRRGGSRAARAAAVGGRAFSIDDDGMLLWLTDRSPAATEFAARFRAGFSGTGNDITGAPKPYTAAGLAKVYAGTAAADTCRSWSPRPVPATVGRSTGPSRPRRSRRPSWPCSAWIRRTSPRYAPNTPRYYPAWVDLVSTRCRATSWYTRWCDNPSSTPRSRCDSPLGSSNTWSVNRLVFSS